MGKLTELKLTPGQAGALATDMVNVFVVVPLGPNARTVIVCVPAGYALVILTAPVAASAARTPLKLVSAETLMLVVSIGTESGVTVALPLPSEPTIVAETLPTATLSRASRYAFPFR